MIWTHYGRWDDEGLRVVNNYGIVIYRLPGCLDEPSMFGGAIVVDLGNLNDLTQDSSTRPVIQQA